MLMYNEIIIFKVIICQYLTGKSINNCLHTYVLECSTSLHSEMKQNSVFVHII